jgi:hypothetical protein
VGGREGLPQKKKITQREQRAAEIAEKRFLRG